MARRSRPWIGAAVVFWTATALAQNHAPNPYLTISGWARMPEGRTWGSTSAVYPAQDGSGNIWVAERCGANSCVGRDDLDSVLLFDPDGNLVKSFGAGQIVWPHGIFVDAGGHVWIADARGNGGKGHQVHKFTADGEILMSLGTAGVAGAGPDHFDQPSDVLVAPNGDIFVVDGHGGLGNNRVVKFSGDGTFLKEWGTTGEGIGEFRDPHALAMDSDGLLYVGDRANARIQIFTQDGEYVKTYTTFGRPSGLFIDENDVLYCADSESNRTWGYNPGFRRGIRIGDAKTGFVTAFIPDPEPSPDTAGTTAAEGVAVDAQGNVYGAEVGPRALKKYVKR